MCVFCEADEEAERREERDLIVYRCPHCNSIMEAYTKEEEDNLKGLFSRYDTSSYKPEIPDYMEGENE